MLILKPNASQFKSIDKYLMYKFIVYGICSGKVLNLGNVEVLDLRYSANTSRKRTLPIFSIITNDNNS